MPLKGEVNMWVFSDETLRIRHQPLNEFDKLRLATFGVDRDGAGQSIGLGPTGIIEQAESEDVQDAKLEPNSK
jgi:hypothetical protein